MASKVMEGWLEGQARDALSSVPNVRQRPIPSRTKNPPGHFWLDRAKNGPP